jgi:hypothetical protein
MLYYALVFLVLALIAGVLGFGGVAAAAVLRQPRPVPRWMTVSVAITASGA